MALFEEFFLCCGKCCCSSSGPKGHYFGFRKDIVSHNNDNLNFFPSFFRALCERFWFWCFPSNPLKGHFRPPFIRRQKQKYRNLFYLLNFWGKVGRRVRFWRAQKCGGRKKGWEKNALATKWRNLSSSFESVEQDKKG